jgi:hypothetical protein
LIDDVRIVMRRPFWVVPGIAVYATHKMNDLNMVIWPYWHPDQEVRARHHSGE